MLRKTPPAGDSWTATSAVKAAFFVLFLLIQVGVPLLRLWSPRPARFGWQMFSASPQQIAFSLVLRDGTSQPVSLGRYVAQSRGEVDLEDRLPPHLCRVVPDVASVEITKPGSTQRRVYRCP
jgi:hypothetical protein